MNTKISIAAISIFLVLVIGASADAQLSDSDLRARSRHYTNQLGQLREFPSTSVVMRGGFPGGVQTSTISVQSGEVVVRLDSEGTLRGYSDLGDSRTEPSRGTERFSSNEQVWSFVERLLPALDAPSDLTRVKIERRGGDGSGKPTFLLRFEQRPFGYKAQAGNIVSCFVHRITGRILELHIGRGWTYEAPNIQIDAGTAKASAATTLGGNASDWNYVLEYDTSPDTATAPQIRELNGRKIMRLCYNLYSRYGGVLIDSVTGHVVWFGTPGIAVTSPNVAGTSPEEAHRLAVSQKAPADKSKAVKSKFGLPEILLTVSIFIVAIVGGIQLWKMRFS